MNKIMDKLACDNIININILNIIVESINMMINQTKPMKIHQNQKKMQPKTTRIIQYQEIILITI